MLKCIILYSILITCGPTASPIFNFRITPHILNKCKTTPLTHLQLKPKIIERTVLDYWANLVLWALVMLIMAKLDCVLTPQNLFVITNHKTCFICLTKIVILAISCWYISSLHFGIICHPLAESKHLSTTCYD